MKTYFFTKSHLVLLFFCSCLFLAASCNSDDEIAPFSENEPHTILHCKINGMDWTPAGGDLFSGYPFRVQYNNNSGSLGIIASRNIESESTNQVINIDTYFYNLDEENAIRFIGEEFTDRFNASECIYYDVDTTSTNYIKITSLDTLNFFMIGEFEFSAINDCNDTIRVTDGYFDLKY